uniref:RING-type domain-containing protein n=1 Tax=Rhabditophanes sp. KR3021 TaxID=114890 RepID=A0AC35TXU9_9BILA
MLTDYPSTSSIADDLNCSICLSILDSPKTIQCGHSYCDGCLNSLYDQSIPVYGRQDDVSIVCPICRKVTKSLPFLTGVNKQLEEICNYTKNLCLPSRAGDTPILDPLVLQKCSTCDKRICIEKMYLCDTCNNNNQPTQNIFYCGVCGWKNHKDHVFVNINEHKTGVTIASLKKQLVGKYFQQGSDPIQSEICNDNLGKIEKIISQITAITKNVITIEGIILQTVDVPVDVVNSLHVNVQTIKNQLLEIKSTLSNILTLSEDQYKIDAKLKNLSQIVESIFSLSGILSNNDILPTQNQKNEVNRKRKYIELSTKDDEPTPGPSTSTLTSTFTPTSYLADYYNEVVHTMNLLNCDIYPDD